MVLHAPDFLLFSFRDKGYSDPDAVWAQPQIVCPSFLSLIVRKASMCTVLLISVDESSSSSMLGSQKKKTKKTSNKVNCLHPKQASLESVVQNVCGFLFFDLLQ